MHAGFAGLRTDISDLKASVADLRATIRTMLLALGVLGMLATLFLTAGKALKWF